MKINKYLIIPVLIAILILASGQLLHAQNAGEQGAQTSIWSSVETIDLILMAFAFLLLLIIILLVNMMQLAMISDEAKRKKPSEASVSKPGKIMMIIILISVGAVNAHAASPGLPEWASALRLFMYAVIILEVVAIFALINWIKYFTGIQEYKLNQKRLRPESKWSLALIWAKINKLRPLEEEASLDTGHSYDGIKELDNATPPWFTYTFIATIIFAAFYMYRYHIAYSAPNQIEEYKIEVAEARAAQQAYLSVQGDLVDENSVKMLDAGGISIGQSIFKANCVACHGAEGQGGVGPNLTDDYWLHGGNIKEVFKSVKYGIVEKGMKGWQEDFSANQIAQLSSYIKSIRGTNPPGPKDKQGELYDIKLDAESITSVTKDTIKTNQNN